MSEIPPIEETRADFIEKIGLITQAEGLPRIAGRVFGLLIFDGELISFGDLATKLQVSRASVSTSIRLLEERGLVKRLAKAGERQDYFQLAPNPFVTLLSGIQHRARTTHTEIEQTINALPRSEQSVERLQEYANFYGTIDSALAIALSNLTKEQADLSGLNAQSSRGQ